MSIRNFYPQHFQSLKTSISQNPNGKTQITSHSKLLNSQNKPLHLKFNLESEKKSLPNLPNTFFGNEYFQIRAKRQIRVRVSENDKKSTCTEMIATDQSGRLEELKWDTLDEEIGYMTRTVRLVQWYPGHIAKAERDLKEQLKWVDVVVEVRDARIPMATTHPDLDSWIGQRKKILVVSRRDMVTSADQKNWAAYFGRNGLSPFFVDGQHGDGILRLTKEALSVGNEINKKRKMKGLLPRAVRAAVVGYPNVGKSALINRLLNRRVCPSAPRPGVTKHVKWVQIGENLDLLDAPGVLPVRIADQAAAARLAICNDIGEAAYAVAGVAAILVEIINRMPGAGPEVLLRRYKMSSEGITGEEFLEGLADRLFQGNVNQASHRLLKDFRRGSLGTIALERPPLYSNSNDL